MPAKRRAVVAGYFYPRNPEQLRKSVEASFLHPLGPGKLPSPSGARDPRLIGYVVPHAGYMYSGPVAAHAYYDLALRGKPQTIVIVGTNHTGMGSLVSVYPRGTWETPLGDVEVDEELANAIVKNSAYAELDELAHVEEHSVEVQLPFLQYIFGTGFRVVPLVVGLHNPDVSRDLAAAIAAASEGLKRDVALLASSDLNHYEPGDVTRRKDEALIREVLELDVSGFYKVLLEENVSACGPGGIMTLMELTRMRGGVAKLLKYANSGDVTGDYSAVVGYASIGFYGKE
ncbi:MAG: AmmeMemoRadiSam system protein B [Desulfurococcaceae archaeon]